MTFPYCSVELQRGRARNRPPMKTTLSKKVEMTCMRSIHRKEFLCHCLSGSALSGAARQSCVSLAGTSLLTNPILPHRTPARHKEKILGWADNPSHQLWMQSLDHTPKPTPSLPALQVSYWTSHWLNPIRSQRTRKPRQALHKNQPPGARTEWKG